LHHFVNTTAKPGIGIGHKKIVFVAKRFHRMGKSTTGIHWHGLNEPIDLTILKQPALLCLQKGADLISLMMEQESKFTQAMRQPVFKLQLQKRDIPDRCQSLGDIGNNCFQAGTETAG
jgi:hypothetical protein